VKYPREGLKFYNGKVIERFDNKDQNETMRMCEGQTLPQGFVIIDEPRDPSVCPREQGDSASGPTYKVILQTVKKKKE